MRRKRKLHITAFALLFSLLLGGCGASGEEIQVVRVWEGTKESPKWEAPADKIMANGRKIGMLTGVGGIEDESFNQSAWDGMESLSKKRKVPVTYIEAAEEEEYVPGFEQLVKENCSLCWGIGYNFTDALLTVAKQHPETHFAIVDGNLVKTPDNATGVVFRSEESSFLVGYIAALVTRTGRIGFVGGGQGEVMDAFPYGYKAGAQYAANIYGKSVEVAEAYTDSFSDPDAGYALASGLYADGCDVVFHAAGGTGIGVIRAAKDNDAFVIGVDKDQSSLAPDHVLTSALKNVDVAVENVSAAYLRGDPIGGETLSFGLVEGAVGIPSGHANYRDEIYDSALTIADKIKAGKIVPPRNARGYTLFLKNLETKEEGR